MFDYVLPQILILGIKKDEIGVSSKGKNMSMKKNLQIVYHNILYLTIILKFRTIFLLIVALHNHSVFFEGNLLSLEH